MTTVVEARQELSDAMNTIDGLQCRPYEGNNNLRFGDSWVVIGRAVPADFTSYNQTLSALVVLGADRELAEKKADEFTIPMLEAVRDIDSFDVSVEPQILPTESGQNLYILNLTLTVEVSA